MRDLRRLVAGSVVFAAITIFGVRVAEACSCGMSTCGNLTAPGAIIFEATVASIELHSDPPPPDMKIPPGARYVGGDRRVIRMKDIKAWRGDAQPMIVTGTGGGDCGYEFKAGERYLIEAYKTNDGPLSTSICSLTRPVRHAEQLIAYLQAFQEQPQQTRVWGAVARITGWRGADGGVTPVKDAQVTFTGPVGATVSTNADGHFLVTGLPPGSYTVTASVNGTPIPPEPEWSPFLLGRDNELCQELAIAVPAKGGLRGAVIDGDGTPIRNAFVYLRPAERDSNGDRRGVGLTLPEGVFEFDDLPPGRYVLEMNTDIGPTPGNPFHETTTAPFAVVEGQVAEAPPLRAVRATRITVTGVVRTSDGKPIANTQVDQSIQLANGKRMGEFPRPKTDRDGRFEIQLWKDLRYVLTVGPERDPWSRIEFIADGQPIAITATPR